MLFRGTNAQANFQNFIPEILVQKLDMIVIVSFNNISIYIDKIHLFELVK